MTFRPLLYGVALLLTAVVTGCASPASSRPSPLRPASAGTRSPRRTASSLPLYVLSHPFTENGGPSAPVSFLTEYFSSEAEPAKPGLLDGKTGLVPCRITPNQAVMHPSDQISLWLYAELELPHSVDRVTLKTASEGASQIYLNGKMVHSGMTGTAPFKADAEAVPEITLNRGRNLLVVHLQNAVVWRFSLRFFGPNADPLLWTVSTRPQNR